MKELMNIKTVWMFVILFNTTLVSAMEKHDSKALTIIDKADLINHEYNHNNPLLRNDILQHFSYCFMQEDDQVKSLETSMKIYMKLRSTCKTFNRLLTDEKMGHLCKNYAQNYKNKALKNLLRNMYDNYKAKRLPALILVYAHADPNITYLGDPLLKRAVYEDDIRLIEILFKHHADPNIKNHIAPVFFYVKTVDTAKIFIDYGVNIQATKDFDDDNVLWHIINEEEYSSQLLAFYLNYGIDTKKLNSAGCCLLHALAKCAYIKNSAGFLDKAKLLFKAMPTMINALNYDNRTPLDIAYKSLKKATEYGRPAACKKLIALFRKYNTLTAKKLVASGVILPNNDWWKEYKKERSERMRLARLETEDFFFFR
jgi:hypothetical protein